MNWKKQLREDGYLEIQGFRIELTLDNTFLDLDYIPRIIVYDEKLPAGTSSGTPYPKEKRWKRTGTTQLKYWK